MLNVWTTSVSSDAKLPVLVFIHGGAHMSGSSSGSESTGFPWYIGSNLAKRGPAVVVTIAYRVGALRVHRASRAVAQERIRRLGELRAHGSDQGSRVGARQYCALRW